MHPSAMPHTSSSPETSSPVHCSGSFPNAAAQHEPDRKQSHIPKVVLVEEGREDNEGILLLKGGLVTPPSKDDSSSSLLPKRTSKIAVSMLQAESSVVEDECTEGDSYDTTKAKMVGIECAGCLLIHLSGTDYIGPDDLCTACKFESVATFKST